MGTSSTPSPRLNQALVVVDFQNDFCSPRGSGAKRRGDLSRLERTAVNIGAALRRARRRGEEVVFVRYLGDGRFKTPNLAARDRRQDRPLKCLQGTWGADFFRIAPLAGEKIFDKHARFDAFTNPAFERHLRRKGVERLVFAGVYLDVCVDSAARTAFQRGFEVTVLSDCVESLHYPKSSVLSFMERHYGARLALGRRY